MQHLKRLLMTGFFTTVFSATTFAQSTKPWEVEVEVGAIATSGNTETTSLNSKLDARQHLERFDNEYILTALYKKDQVTQDDGSKLSEKTAEKFFASAKSAYQLSAVDKSYLFGFISHTHDQFGAYRDYSTLALGYGDWLFNTDTFRWFAEAGPGYFRGEKVIEPDVVGNPLDFQTQSGALLRLATRIEWNLSANAVFKQTLSVEAGSDNTRSQSETSLAAAINHTMQMKLALAIANDSKVDEDKKPTDVTTSITLVYKF
jgi:putative salt-induced outer membrane protein